MAYGFATWDQNGVDNNTGLVRINAIGTQQIPKGGEYTFDYSIPPGASALGVLFQATGENGGSAARRRIYTQGGQVLVRTVSNGDYSANTYPDAPGMLLVFAR